MTNPEIGKNTESNYFETNFGRSKCGQLPALIYYRGKLLPKLSSPSCPIRMVDGNKPEAVRRKTTASHRRKHRQSEELLNQQTAQDNSREGINNFISSEELSNSHSQNGDVSQILYHALRDHDNSLADHQPPFANDYTGSVLQKHNSTDDMSVSGSSNELGVQETGETPHAKITITSYGSGCSNLLDNNISRMYDDCVRLPVATENDASPGGLDLISAEDAAYESTYPGVDPAVDHAGTGERVVAAYAGTIHQEPFLPGPLGSRVIRESVRPLYKDLTQLSHLLPKTDAADGNVPREPGIMMRSLSVHTMPVNSSFNRPRASSLSEITRRVFLLVAVAMVFVLPKALFLQCASYLDEEVAAYVYVIIKLIQYSSFLAHHAVYVCMLKPLMRLLAS
ncbi:hypothetical protein LSH36_1027g01054 [Paralvinella palmiformis]|uniref:Uncharacterized protein n=1 Tax=Paralvinella palmiformis TaxID=53620 RepID=A0AAD9IXH7_9ANNE|nr:hypothetical protein LSH36_1027g01054 [Paralvinella palmiformis]